METLAHDTELAPAQRSTNSRLESFGDIVFGFTLVSMATRLRVPQKPEDLIAELPDFGVFLLAFAVLCVLWFRQHVLFRDLFVPDPAGIVLNFVVLAAIAVFAYPLELYIKLGQESAIALAGYAVVLGVLNAAFGALCFKGLHQRGGGLDERRHSRAEWTATRASVLGIAFLCCGLAYPLGVQAMFEIIAGVMVAGLGGYAVWRRLRGRYA